MVQLLVALFLPLAAADTSPWCTNASAPALVGMYGDMGIHAGRLVNPAGRAGSLGQYVDLPDDAEVVGLFRQGLAHIFGFNNVEAQRNFKTTVALAPDCALCLWGLAWTRVANINYHIEDQAALNELAQRALDASRRQPNLTRKSQTLIAALAAFINKNTTSGDSPDSPNRAAAAKILCATAAGEDPDMDAFCASATMARSPWNYYQGMALGTRVPIKAMFAPIKARLLLAINKTTEETGVPHVFATHLLIHLLEPSNSPEAYRWEALPAATQLFNGSRQHAGELVPAQGHLTHMSAHLFLRTGRYADGVATSKVSVADNERYRKACLVPYGMGHDAKMLVAHARLAGMFADALKYAAITGTAEAGPEPSPAGGEANVDCAGLGSPEVVLTLLRAGRFKDVLQVQMPTQWGIEELAKYHEASYHYARAAALFALGGAANDTTLVAQGDSEAAAAVTAAHSPTGGDQKSGANYSGIIPADLRALRSWHVTKDHAAAIDAFAEVVAVNDATMYMEPPRFYYPPRQCLGAALLGAAPPHRNATRALAVFEQDLDAFVENAWSLHGAALACDALGRLEDAKQYRTRADAAWASADTAFVSPCPQLKSSG